MHCCSRALRRHDSLLCPRGKRELRAVLDYYGCQYSGSFNIKSGASLFTAGSCAQAYEATGGGEDVPLGKCPCRAARRLCSLQSPSSCSPLSFHLRRLLRQRCVQATQSQVAQSFLDFSRIQQNWPFPSSSSKIIWCTLMDAIRLTRSYATRVASRSSFARPARGVRGESVAPRLVYAEAAQLILRSVLMPD